MKYKIEYAYCWYDQGSMIVKMYFISGVPFTFDELPHYAYEDPELMKKADLQRRFEPDDLHRSSFYLIDEEAHPCLFDLELENPQDMPTDE